MDCQVNDAHLENDLNARLGPNCSGLIRALEAAREDCGKNAFLFRESGAVGLL